MATRCGACARSEAGKGLDQGFGCLRDFIVICGMIEAEWRWRGRVPAWILKSSGWHRQGHQKIEVQKTMDAQRVE